MHQLRLLDFAEGDPVGGGSAFTVTRPAFRSTTQTRVPSGTASRALATPSGMVVRTDAESGCVNWIFERNVPGTRSPQGQRQTAAHKTCLSVGHLIAKQFKYPRGYWLSIAKTREVRKWRQTKLVAFGVRPLTMSNFLRRRDPRVPADARARGLSIASQPGRVTELDVGVYRVIADVSGKRVLVHRREDRWECHCAFACAIPDGQCEHVWAVRFTEKSRRKDEAVIEVIGTLDDRTDSERAFTEGQKATGRMFGEMLGALLSGVAEPRRTESRPGRPPLPLRDGLFCTIKKVFSGDSCRTFYSEMEEDASIGLISHVPNWSVASRILCRPELTPVLLDLVSLSAAPLVGVESGGTVAIDSTGFAAHWFGGYFLEAHKVDRHHDWVKAHLAVGTRTHIVTAAIVNERGGDAPEFPGLLRSTIQAGFEPSAVVADRGYLSRRNYDAAAQLGIPAFIPFKSNSRPKPSGTRVWRDMYHLFALHDGQFDNIYHRRSQIESANSAMKRKMGEPLLSKGVVSRRNEVLCKIIGYNITVLIMEMFRTGIDPLRLLHQQRHAADYGGRRRLPTEHPTSSGLGVSEEDWAS